MRFSVKHLLPGAMALTFATSTWAGQTQIAVAANFAEPIKAIAAVLEKTTGHTLSVTVGATGKLYAQIKNGAPFDVLLAANTAATVALEKDGLAKAGSSFAYANGKLVLWSADATEVDARGDVLKGAGFRKLAYANPKTAPYGEAAVQTIDKLGLTTALTPKLVQGESIGQAFNFVYTGNAEIGFVAMSQVLAGGKLKSGSMWVVPQALYSPIRQNAVLLNRGANNPAAVALVKLLQSPNIKDLIRSYGYDI
ncbi:MAG: molybdate ABC transporter substrate-binding protein [Rhodoferax sp.]|uniref:molybdate ABC transporter substrate-binding protein n=1 Tax=Rhodoferax sp. TaxID=50421 RepID=UPI0008CF4551|nr:molybdate ABC transporter substrate-binding protein [Rhodoferax sp.]MDP2680415.1 molybdate ABC transporter substrate-binding protein [Rhodoferax sp.]OGB53653.1 MAG: molybdate ABC transporter substrate-binding protein [Burkholderiales bacterium RIFOXYD12_FULL_59_19]OGB81352.1 MAG: molybdate ABC transporter substrate-binding protein [Burkholderiales bacterium RIFOXYC12_FULL_60_6]OGB87258.1 MAG: molybdate ABC transporter substrate-binding protein [Burkholderiales bacterium RIFOXYD2_FULL_59_8]